MSTKTFLSSMVALFAAMLIMSAPGAGTANAQLDPPCCNYFVDVLDITRPCFPITLYTQWDCNGVATPLTTTYSSNGNFSHPLNACPCRLRGASLDGMTYIGINRSFQYFIGDCCYVLSCTQTDDGCIRFRITGC